tara:strand:- start:1511 stop:2044 length:534 start_codon:yes stop_codon:yes gene_type:complete
MGSSDIANAIIIIVIFACMQLTITLSIGIARIKKNWDKYKCNPAVIPFARTFGYDPLETFNQCVLTSQADFMSTFLNPVYSSLTSLIENGNIMREMFQYLKMGLNSNQLATLNLGEEIGARVKKLITALNDVLININDVFGKLSSVVTTLFFLIETTIATAYVMDEELPGLLVRMID